MTVANNGRVFISHSHDDNSRCAPLLTALDAWGVDYFFDTQGLTAGHQLNERIQRELSSRDIMVRVCTSATKVSFWMSLEGNAFRGLQAEDQRNGHRDRRLLINVILDGDYSREPFDAATLFIDTVNRPRAAWMNDLARAIGVVGRSAAQKMSRRSIVGLGAAGAVALGSAALAGSVYATYHPVSAEAAVAPHDPGRVIWTLPHASPKKDYPPSPTIVGDGLYVMSGLLLAAYDLTQVTAQGPAKRWGQPLSVQNTYVSPSVYGDTLFVGVDTTLAAFNAKTGAKKWARDIAPDSAADVWSSALQSGDTLYVLDTAAVLHACHAQSGAELWHVSVSAVPVNLASVLLPTASTPALDGDSLYIGSFDHHVYAFRASDGATRWKTITRGKILSSPVVSDGAVYLGSTDGYLYALDTRDGSVKWKYRTGQPVNSTPVVADGVVYFASDDHYVYALDATTGKPFWRAPLGDLDTGSGFISNGGPMDSAVVVTGDAVCAMDNLNYVIRSYNRADGALRWTYKSKDTVNNAPPIGAHGVILFGCGDENIYAIGA